MSWVATSRAPVEKGKSLGDVKPPDGLTSLSKAERKQYDAANEAAALMAKSIDGEVNVAISGDVDTDHIEVVVAKA